jgi:hypothetical protein
MTKSEIPALPAPATCPVSGLRFIETEGTSGLVDYKVEAIEADSASLEINATAHSIEDIDSIIATLQALKATMAMAELVRGAV